MAKRVVILGGYGHVGRRIASGLLRRTDLQVVIAGRNGTAARNFAAELDEGRGRVIGRAADVADPQSLRHAIHDAHLTIFASSTTARAGEALDACLDVGSDYMDTQLSLPSKWSALSARRSRIEAEGRTVLPDGGFHPGLPALMVRWAMTQLEGIRAAVVASLIRHDWQHDAFGADTKREFAQELRETPMEEFRDGEWRHVGFREYPSFDFGPHHGRQSCAPMRMEEMRVLAEAHPELRRLGFFVSGFHPVFDVLALPTAWALAAIPGAGATLAGELLARSFRQFSRPPFVGALLLQAEGQGGSLTLRLQHADVYQFTAAPVVACVEQWLRGAPVGLRPQALFLDPEATLESLREQEISISQRLSGNPAHLVGSR